MSEHVNFKMSHSKKEQPNNSHRRLSYGPSTKFWIPVLPYMRKFDTGHPIRYLPSVFIAQRCYNIFEQKSKRDGRSQKRRPGTSTKTKKDEDLEKNKGG